MKNVSTKIPGTSKKVYVASPLRAPTRSDVRKNMNYALRVVEMIRLKRPDIRAYAPHGYLPDMLDDNFQDERELALTIGRMVLSSCDTIFVCGDRISAGMKEEINVAIKEGKEIVSSKRLQHAVQQYVDSVTTEPEGGEAA